MAEKKQSIPLDDAIQELWNSFFRASDDTFLKLFCETYKDERIPEGFLENYLTKLKNETEAGNWSLEADPTYEIPIGWMNNAIKKMKKKISKQKKKLEKMENEEIGDEKFAQENEEIVDEKFAEENEEIGDEKFAEENEEIVDENFAEGGEIVVAGQDLTEEELKENRRAFQQKIDKCAATKKKLTEVKARKNRVVRLTKKMKAQEINMSHQLAGTDKLAG